MMKDPSQQATQVDHSIRNRRPQFDSRKRLASVGSRLKRVSQKSRTVRNSKSLSRSNSTLPLQNPQPNNQDSASSNSGGTDSDDGSVPFPVFEESDVDQTTVFPVTRGLINPFKPLPELLVVGQQLVQDIPSTLTVLQSCCNLHDVDCNGLLGKLQQEVRFLECALKEELEDTTRWQYEDALSSKKTALNKITDLHRKLTELSGFIAGHGNLR